ncbi:Uncharacterised protein [Mycobacteroides abscessus]|nr:Uncharacterised protein [Mycobacteroides abscessus]
MHGPIANEPPGILATMSAISTLSAAPSSAGVDLSTVSAADCVVAPRICANFWAYMAAESAGTAIPLAVL